MWVDVALEALGADFFHHALHGAVDGADGDVVVFEIGLKRGVAGLADAVHHAIRADGDYAVDAVGLDGLGAEIEPNRPQDAQFRGNIVQAMIAYAEGRLGEQTVDLKDVDRIIAIGSDRMMNGVREARHTTLKPYLNEHHVAIGSINSPMQCMMKEVCAQCLQRHVNPHTGEEFFVFSCFNQDQHLDFVDFKNLNERLRANSVQEKLTNLWLVRALAMAGVKAPAIQTV